jgi:hypothetical protein
MLAVSAVAITELIRTLFGTFGPFLIPATLFVAGVVGYLLLYALGRFRSEDWYGKS